MKVRVAAVNTQTAQGSGSHVINLERAAGYVAAAKKQGAHIICFPETYPGPWKEPQEFLPYDAMSSIAKENDIFIIYGLGERLNPESPDAHHITECLVGPDGKLIGKYNRCTPLGPWRYGLGMFWKLNYIAANNVPVFETDIGKIGMLVCSEVFVPEMSRSLAVQGAELAFLPAGILTPNNKGLLYDNWATLIKARAIENLMYTVTCQNILEDERGLTLICSPEGDSVFSDTEGITVMDCDLDRLRQIRAGSDSDSNAETRFRSKPGVLREWLRSDVYLDALNNSDKK